MSGAKAHGKHGVWGARDSGPESKHKPALLPEGGNFPGREPSGRGRRAAVPLAEAENRAHEVRGARRARRPPPPPLPASAGAASSLRAARPPSLPPLVAGSGSGGGGGRGGRAPAERCRRRGKGSFKWKVVGRPARPPALLRQHHGGAERLARARPAAPAGGPGDSGGGDGGRDSSAGPGGARGAGPGAGPGPGSGPGPRGAGRRLAHLQGRVRAAGGYRSVPRAQRNRAGGAAGGGRGRGMLGSPARAPGRQSGRLRGLPASTVFFFFLIYLFVCERWCCRRRRGGCDSHCRQAACCKLLSPRSPGRRSRGPGEAAASPSTRAPGPQPVAGGHAGRQPLEGWGCGGAALGFQSPPPGAPGDPAGAAAPPLPKRGACVPGRQPLAEGKRARRSGGGPGSWWSREDAGLPP